MHLLLRCLLLVEIDHVIFIQLFLLFLIVNGDCLLGLPIKLLYLNLLTLEVLLMVWLCLLDIIFIQVIEQVCAGLALRKLAELNLGIIDLTNRLFIILISLLDYIIIIIITVLHIQQINHSITIFFSLNLLTLQLFNWFLAHIIKIQKILVLKFLFLLCFWLLLLRFLHNIFRLCDFWLVLAPLSGKGVITSRCKYLWSNVLLQIIKTLKSLREVIVQ